MIELKNDDNDEGIKAVIEEQKKRAKKEEIVSTLVAVEKKENGETVEVPPKSEPAQDQTSRNVLCIKSVFADAKSFTKDKIYNVSQSFFNSHKEYFVIKAIDEEQSLATENEKRLIRYIGSNMHAGVILSNVMNQRVISQSDIVAIIKELETEGR